MKRNTFLKIISSIVVIYTLLGFFLIPFLIKSQGVKTINEMLKYKANIEKVSFNPYTFELNINNFTINDKDEKIISFDSFYINFSLLKSLEETHINLKELKLNKPFAKLVLNEKGELNLANILKENNEETKAQTKNQNKKQELINFLIKKLQINNGDFLVVQEFKGKESTLSINNFNYTFYDLGSYKNSLASHSLITKLNENTNLSLSGGLRLEPLSFYGKFNLSNLNPKEFTSFSKDLLNFELSDSKLALNFGFRMNTKEEFNFYIDNANLKLENIDIIQKNKKLLGFKTFATNGVDYDLSKKFIDINNVSLDSLYANINILKDGKLNLQNLIKSPKEVNEKENIKENKSPSNLKFLLDNFSLTNSNISFKDEKSKMYVKSSFGLNTNNIIFEDNILNIDKISLNNQKTSINSKTKIDINKLNIDVSKLNLQTSNSDLKVNSLEIASKDILVFDKTNKTDIKLENLKLLANNILKSNELLKLRDISVNKPKAYITLNKKEETKKETTNSKKDKQNKQTAGGLKLDIGPIKIDNANIIFEDKNLPIPFVANISKLNGSFSEFKTASSKPTKLNLEGQIDKYGYSKITGFVDHKNIKNLTDVNMIFKNIAIKNFTPYSGKFVGRELDAGKLNLNLKYNIKKSNLDAKNSIIITDIKLGEKVESPNALDLPLELGIALLEDSDGVIDIDLPITGNMDDPQFSIAPIVWKAFTNLIVKAVSAPFTFLASILGLEADEINSVDFLFAKTNIIASEKETLDKLSKALIKKPKLSLKINPSYHTVYDVTQLKKIKLENEITKTSKTLKSKDKYFEAIKTLYKNQNNKKSLKDLEESFVLEVKDEKSKKTYLKLDKEKYISFMKTKLLEKTKISKERLQNLAKKRAKSIKQYLTNEKGIDKKRVEILQEIIKVDDKSSKYLNTKMEIGLN